MANMSSIIDAEGQEVAEIAISEIEDGWYCGTVVRDEFSEKLKQALEWYDEVVSDQMLSFVDEALAAVDRFQLRVCLSDESCEDVYSLQLSKNGEVTFRITPVPPPGTGS